MKKLLILIFTGIINIVNAQSIDLKDVRLNKSIPYVIKLTELKLSDTKIDSIKPIPELMDMSMADSLIYIGKTYFEFYKNSDKCILNVVQFDDEKTELKIGDITLNKNTTENDIAKYFTQNCKTTGEIEIYDENEKFRSCDIPITLNGELTYNKLILFFLNGKLNRIDFWEPS